MGPNCYLTHLSTDETGENASLEKCMIAFALHFARIEVRNVPHVACAFAFTFFSHAWVTLVDSKTGWQKRPQDSLRLPAMNLVRAI